MANYDKLSPEQKVQAIYSLSRGLVNEAAGLAAGKIESPDDFLTGLSVLTGLAMASTGLKPDECKAALVKMDTEEADGRALAVAGERGEKVTLH